MSCSAFDVRDYFLGELPEAERLPAGRHIQSCDECAGELEQLKLMRSALTALPDEEPPQRIGFVSDKVFEESPVRRWLGAFWVSGARLGFASAALLAIALVVTNTRQPVRVVETKTVAASTAVAPAQVQAIVDQAVRRAVAETEVRQEKKTRALLAASEAKSELTQKALNAQLVQLADSYDIMVKRNRVLRASAMEFGGQQ